MTTLVQPPIWFWIVSAVLMIWNAIGCWFCFQQFRHGADSMPGATDYDRALFAGLPFWYNYCYALAVGTGTLGGLALLLRCGWAYPLFIMSFVALVFQFGYLFVTTDIIKQKGFGRTVPFPIVIALIGAFAIWFACCAASHGWVA
jgi:hypothetical protein